MSHEILKVERFKMSCLKLKLGVFIVMSILSRLGRFIVHEQMNEPRLAIKPNLFYPCEKNEDTLYFFDSNTTEVIPTAQSQQILPPVPETLVLDENWNGIPGKEHLLFLDTKSYSAYMKNCPKWLLILFYSPKCEYSKATQPDFAKAASKLNIEKAHWIKLASINCDSDPMICKDQKIIGFPTLNLYYGGKYVEEVKLRKYATLLTYARNPPRGWFRGWL